MKKIKDVTDRTKHNKKMGLFRCPYCFKAAKRPVAQGAKQNGCGCVRKWGGKQLVSGAAKYKRLCLMCNKPFPSRDVGNRRCPVCELKVEQAGYNTYYEPPVYGHTASSNIRDHSEDY